MFGKRQRDNKILLTPVYQKKALREAILVARRISRHPDIKHLYIIGSVLREELGKYCTRKGKRSDYSDIDVFIVTAKPLRQLQLAQMGLIKKKYTVGMKRYYRVSIREGNAPLKIFGLFSMDTWFITPSRLKPTMKRFPRILDTALQIK